MAVRDVLGDFEKLGIGSALAGSSSPESLTSLLASPVLPTPVAEQHGALRRQMQGILRALTGRLESFSAVHQVLGEEIGKLRGEVSALTEALEVTTSSAGAGGEEVGA